MRLVRVHLETYLLDAVFVARHLGLIALITVTLC
jgi:hypothetical protein